MTEPALQVSSDSLIFSSQSTLTGVVKHFGPNMMMCFFSHPSEISIKQIFVFCGLF